MYSTPHPSTTLSATHPPSTHLALLSSASVSNTPPQNSSTTMESSPRSITAYSLYAPTRGERRNYLQSTSYSTSVPRRVQISPGVWSDGNDHVLSAAYPPVQLVLKEARSSLKQPVIQSDLVFALAALEVFYKPSDPAHWIFWSDEKKDQTAEVVTRIALHQPPLIRAPVAWNGANEYLPILANHHGATYRHYYESRDWYRKIVPPKSSAASKVLNLRKRKPNPGAFREPSKSPGLEEDEIIEEPPRKKVKGHVRTTPLPFTATRKATVASTESSTKPTASKTGLASSPHNSHEISARLADTTEHQAASTDEIVPIRMTTRNQKAAAALAPSSSSRASSVSVQDTPASSTLHSRNRSISHASSQTAVASQSNRRSASVISASTIVESDKSKHSSDDADKYTESQSDNDEGMVTRGRASRYRVVETLKDVDTKSGKQVVRNGVQRTKRKI